MKMPLSVFAVVSVVVLAACSSDSETSEEASAGASSEPQVVDPPPEHLDMLAQLDPLNADEQAYLDRIANLVEESEQDIQGRTFDTLGRLFPDWAPEDIQQAVVINEYREEAKAVKARIYSDIELLKSIAPPSRFESDHQTAIKYLESVDSLNQEFQTAIDGGDFITVISVRAKQRSNEGRTLLSLSPEFCSATISDPVGQDICIRLSPAEAGDYGLAVRQIAMDWNVAFNPFVSVFSSANAPGQLTDDQRMDAFAKFHPEITAIHDGTAAALKSLDPPADYAEGHQVLVEHWAGLAEIAHAIDDAVAARDAEQMYVEFEKSGDVFQESNAALPLNIRPFVIGVFPPDIPSP